MAYPALAGRTLNEKLGESVIGILIASYKFSREIIVVNNHPLSASIVERTNVEAFHPQ